MSFELAAVILPVVFLAGSFFAWWIDDQIDVADWSWRQRFGLPKQKEKIETALRDFVVAYDDQEPEQLLSAYLGAADILNTYDKSSYRK